MRTKIRGETGARELMSGVMKSTRSADEATENRKRFRIQQIARAADSSLP